MKRQFPFFPLILAGLLAGLSFWLEHYVRTQAQTPDGKLRHDPDMIAEKSVQERFNVTGGRQYILEAEKLVHYPDDDTTHVIQPRLEHFGKPQPMHISADTAEVRGEGSEVKLAGNVQGRRDAMPDLPSLSFTTSEITILPDDERAFTRAPVHMTRGRTVIDGTGLEIDQISGLATLNEVQASIYPKSQEIKQ